MAELLALDDLAAGYGESVVIEEVTLAIGEGESLALLGRNGVGKTTLLATMMGLTRMHHGRVLWRGEDARGWPPHRRARAGLGWVPQERGMWRSLTVAEHLESVARPGPWSIAAVHKLFPRLEERAQHRGGQLSGGEQQMVAIARALVTNPRLLLLDEPMEGLAPIVVQELGRVIRELASSGTLSVVLVEQHAELALSLTQRAIVMERGRIVHDGPSAALQGEPEALAHWLAVGA